MNPVILAVLTVGFIGLIVGLVLAIASALMSVPRDEKAQALLALLPGANCGACGYSGCSGYANALSKGTAKPGLCSPGGAETTKAIAAMLGTEPVENQRKTAVVFVWADWSIPQTKCFTRAFPPAERQYSCMEAQGNAAMGVWGLATVKPPVNTTLLQYATGLPA